MIVVKRTHRPAASPPADPVLRELREKWAPEWTIWRSRNSRGELNEWCATHREPSMTLMEPTAVALEAALADAPVWLALYV